MVKLTWDRFQLWQRWDEYPERKDDPPMTVDMTFWYEDELYYLDTISREYAILTEKCETVAADPNFLVLLNKPVQKWKGRSFHELIDEMIFKN